MSDKSFNQRILTGYLEKHTELFPVQESQLIALAARGFLAVFKIPNFSDYKQFADFVDRETNPFSENIDFSFASSHLHFVFVTGIDLKIEKGQTKYDWFNSKIYVKEILGNNFRETQSLTLEDKSKTIYLWMTFGWKMLMLESTGYILDKIVAPE